MAAMLVACCWLSLSFVILAAAERWIPDNVWDKLLRALHVDE